ncbi:WecB/TagA/CpsF family glycosyltransferase [Candidatus Margulisiibacteriota bacterium]
MKIYPFLDYKIDIFDDYESLCSTLKKGKTKIITLNPEMIMAAQKEKSLHDLIQSFDIKINDGSGLTHFMRKKYKEKMSRMTGIDLIEHILKEGVFNKIYLLGAKPKISQKTKEVIVKQYPNVSVVGYHHGYFEEIEEQKIIEDIQQSHANLVLVGLGFPKQEQFITKYYEQLPQSIGVGGSFDVISGYLKRAPRILHKLHLEWLFRILQEPLKRIKKLFTLLRFYQLGNKWLRNTQN